MYSHQSPKISVIVPVYNVEKYLPRCIDSILSQTFKDFELLLIDDGSPDNCGNICDEYAIKDSRVKVIHKQNGGVSSARNVGIENAKGEWITYIDADDYIEQGFLSIPEDATEDLLIQNYKVLYDNDYTDTKFINEVIEQLQYSSHVGMHIVDRIFRVPWAKFFKRCLIVDNSILFAQGVKIGEDTLFMLEYLCHSKSIQYLSTSSYVYRKEGSGLTHKYLMPAYRSVEIFRLLVEKYKQLKVDSTEYLVFMFTLYYSLISPRNYASLKCWSDDPIVKQVYNVIKSKSNLRWRVRYWISPWVDPVCVWFHDRMLK